MPPILVEATDPARLRDLRRRHAHLHRLRASQPPSPDWAVQINDNYPYLDPYWWTVLFPALAIASLVVAVNLVSDGVQQALRAMSAPAGGRRARARATSTSSYRVRGSDRRGAARSLAADRAGASRTGSSASRAAASRRRRSRSSATCRATARSPGGTITVAGQDVARRCSGRELREFRARTRLDGLPEPRRRAEPVDQVGAQVAEAFTVLRRAAQARRATAPARRSRGCRSPTPAR